MLLLWKEGWAGNLSRIPNPGSGWPGSNVWSIPDITQASKGRREKGGIVPKSGPGKIRKNEKGKEKGTWEEVLRHFGAWEGMLREAFYILGLGVHR